MIVRGTSSKTKMSIGPLQDLCGYKAYWHAYSGQALPFRILYPYNYNPNSIYPLIVYLPGSGAYSYASETNIGYSNVPQVTNGNLGTNYFGINNGEYTPLAINYPCFVIALLAPFAQSEAKIVGAASELQAWMDSDSSYYRRNDLTEGSSLGYVGKTETFKLPEKSVYFNYVSILSYVEESPNCWWVNAVLSLINRLVRQQQVFYKKSDLSQSEELLPVSIDKDRIYLVGYSLGCSQQVGFLTAGRELFAGALFVDAYPANIFSNLWSYYWGNENYSKIVKAGCRIFKDISHIPALTYVSEEGTDALKQSVSFGHLFRLLNGATNSYLVGATNGTHNIYYIFNDVLKFDVLCYDRKQYFTTNSGSNYKSPIEWLFSLTRNDSQPQKNAGGFIYNHLPKEVITGNVSGCYVKTNNITRVKENSIYWPYDELLPLCYLHNDGYRKAPEGSKILYEVVDKNCDTYLVLDRPYRIKNIQNSGNVYKLVWDAGRYEKEFTVKGQKEEIKTNEGVYQIEYLGQVEGYKNQRFLMTGPHRKGIL